MVNDTAVYGIYPSKTAAERAVESLKQEGFGSSDVSVLMADRDSTEKFADDNDTKAPEGASTGAAAGATVGGVLGWLAGIGSLAIPGVGPFIAAGPIMGALAGMGVGGTLGGITGALIGMGLPEHDAKHYDTKVTKQGGILVSVHTTSSEELTRARSILQRTGAEDVSSSGKSGTTGMVGNL